MDSKYEDRTDDCPYGPPGGPQFAKTTRDCPLVEVDENAGACASISYLGTIVPLLEDPSRGRCTSACHATEEAALQSKIHLPPNDPEGLYAALTSYRDPRGDPYVGIDEDVERSWIQCNVAAEEGGQSPMPPDFGLESPEDIELIRLWVQCGAKPDGESEDGNGSREDG